MRLLILAVLAGCSGGAAQPDALPDASPLDCATTIAIDATEVVDIASDGTNLFVSTRDDDTSFRMQMTPIGGGSSTTLASGSEAIPVTSFGDAVFYAVRAGASYELHQHVGANDSVLGSVPANRALELAANAIDLYALGADSDDMTTVWRVSRGGGAPAPVLSTMGTAHGLALGATIGAVYVRENDTTTLRVISLAAPYPITEHATDREDTLHFVGDAAFTFSAGRHTQNTSWIAINQVLPARQTITTTTLYQRSLGPIFTDDRYVYLIEGNSAAYMTPDGEMLGSTCAPGVRGVQDATRFFGVVPNGEGQWFVTMVDKP